ncbi:hypothetical protein [uncultured Hymenobacter sp.]|uniref:hypothetical protein n=1 Tax=uncultured Hymenobacter sp. TaxID=170016 RepID=UPI0035CB323B
MNANFQWLPAPFSPESAYSEAASVSESGIGASSDTAHGKAAIPTLDLEKLIVWCRAIELRLSIGIASSLRGSKRMICLLFIQPIPDFTKS